jgi:hypothetical protein
MQISDVTGIKVKYLSGHESRYFAYRANPDLTLRAVSQIPFNPYSKYDDTLCRRVSGGEFEIIRQHISAMEFESSSFFWQAFSEQTEVYECIKIPYRHTLLIHRESNSIFHRMELVVGA